MCEQAGTPELYDDDLTEAQASKRIDEMREKGKRDLGVCDGRANDEKRSETSSRHSAKKPTCRISQAKCSRKKARGTLLRI